MFDALDPRQAPGARGGAESFRGSRACRNERICQSHISSAFAFGDNERAVTNH